MLILCILLVTVSVFYLIEWLDSVKFDFARMD